MFRLAKSSIHCINSNDITLRLTKDHTLFTLSNIKKNNTFNHVIASLFCIKYETVIDSYSLRYHLKTLNLDILNIFIITDKPYHSKKKNKVNFNEPRLLTIQVITTTDFQNLVSSSDFNDINLNNLYILDGISWHRVVKLLISSDVSVAVSGGSAGKRHVISKLDNRLISYLLAMFDLDASKLNAANNFDSVEKIKYLPFMDFSNKRAVRYTDSQGHINHIDVDDKVSNLTTPNTMSPLFPSSSKS